jgi:hypothetical protein
VHGDIASSNVLLTRRGARGACGRLGVGRLRAKARAVQLHASLACLPACWAPAAACGAGANTHTLAGQGPNRNRAAHTSTHLGTAWSAAVHLLWSKDPAGRILSHPRLPHGLLGSLGSLESWPRVAPCSRRARAMPRR